MENSTTKTLYLTYDGLTDPLGQSQILPYIVGLTQKGYRFDIISFEKPEKYATHKKIIEKVCNENNIIWHPLAYTKRPPVLSTIFDVWKLKKEVKRLQQQKNIKIVHCRSYITSLVGLKMKRKANVKFIFDMRGFWADERVDGNLWNLRNLVYRLVYNYFKKKEAQFIQHSDKIVSLTNAGKKEISSWQLKKVKSEKICVIPCAADYDLFQPVTPEKQEKAKLNLGLQEDDFVLLYLGSLGTWYLLDEMLQFFDLLKREKKNAKFLFLTATEPNEIIEAAKKYDLVKEDFIIRFAQRNEIGDYAHAADYGIFFIKPVYSKISSSPTKMGEMLAMGIPIISNNIGDVKEITAATDCGFCLNDIEKHNFEQIISKMSEKNYDSVQLREKSRAFFDLEKGIEKYQSIYAELSK